MLTGPGPVLAERSSSDIAERMAADAMKVTERQATSRDEIELSRIESRVRTEEKHEIYPLVPGK